jgi:hypothetical protein
MKNAWDPKILYQIPIPNDVALTKSSLINFQHEKRIIMLIKKNSQTHIFEQKPKISKTYLSSQPQYPPPPYPKDSYKEA